MDTVKESVTDAVAEAKGRWARLKRRRPSVRHLAEAWALLDRNRGNQFAAAITYFSFLALFPLLLLGVAVLGFVLHADQHLFHTVLTKITQKVPGEFGDTLKDSIKSAVEARTGVGIIGLAGVLVTGLGWIGNLRSAIEAVWGKPPVQRNFFVAKGVNLVVLAGLGVALVLSLGLTVAGTALTDQVLRGLSLDDLPGVHVLLKILGVLLAVVGDMIIFGWLLVRLPGIEVPTRIKVKGVLLAAVGFEVLKIVGTYTIAASSHSATAGPFASILAVLIWIQLVARFMLFCCAWTAVLTREASERTQALPYQPVRREAPELITPEVRSFGAGAAAGAFLAWVLLRPTSRPRR